MTHPWDGYIYLLIYHTHPTIHVGKYTVRPMDGMGFGGDELLSCKDGSMGGTVYFPIHGWLNFMMTGQPDILPPQK